eukprot:s11125_g1.t1
MLQLSLAIARPWLFRLGFSGHWSGWCRAWLVCGTEAQDLAQSGFKLGLFISWLEPASEKSARGPGLFEKRHLGLSFRGCGLALGLREVPSCDGSERVAHTVQSHVFYLRFTSRPEVIAGIARGFQETVFAYGQTGSGKTHTILGSAKELGVLQLCAQELFQAASFTLSPIALLQCRPKSEKTFKVVSSR